MDKSNWYTVKATEISLIILSFFKGEKSGKLYYNVKQRQSWNIAMYIQELTTKNEKDKPRKDNTKAEVPDKR